MPAVVLAVVAALVTACGSLVGLWFFLGSGLPSIRSLTDSPKGVMSDYLAVSVELQKTLDSVDDNSSTDVLIEKIRQLTDRCHAITRRAALMGPFSQEELDSLAQWLQDNAPTDPIKVAASIENFKQRESSMDRRLKSALWDLSLAMSNVTRVSRKAWAAIPEPSNEREEVEYKIVMAQRRAWVAREVGYRDQDQTEVVKSIDAAVADLQAIYEEHRSLIESKRLLMMTSPYYRTTFSMPPDVLKILPEDSPRTDALRRLVEINQKILGASRSS